MSGRRLVLCFDGTGNQFQGDRSDTNVVKIYRRLDRDDADQFSYYQPGIGTYSDTEYTGLFRWFANTRRALQRGLDKGFANTFQSHVMAGYKFVMRYWQPGDEIYIFGFSRGAYTARFLAQMIKDVGLLAHGNEELLPFAWNTFSTYMRNLGSDSEENKKQRKFVDMFRNTFTRLDCSIHFLGLFDCVASVSQFDLPWSAKTYTKIPTLPAKHIRHAVAIHERRLKFKPALFAADMEDTGENAACKEEHTVKEVWFAGNHGDVGGGWHPQDGQKALLSDIALDWMLKEVMNHKNENQPANKTDNHAILPPKFITRADLIARGISSDDDFIAEGTDICNTELDPTHFYHAPKTTKTAQPEERTPLISVQNGTQHQLSQPVVQHHDVLLMGGYRGSSILKWLLWWTIETLPFFKRLELENGIWVPRRWPSNLGTTRDIPNPSKDKITQIHGSVGILGQIKVFDLAAYRKQVAHWDKRD